MQGVKSVKKTDLNARYLFISPPSIEELKSRLTGRGTETEDSLQKELLLLLMKWNMPKLVLMIK